MAEEEKATLEPAPSEVSRMEPAPSAAVFSKMAHKPTKPVMGGLTQTDTDKWIAWTGGKP